MALGPWLPGAVLVAGWGLCRWNGLCGSEGRGEEFNPGPGMRLDHSELLCHKVLLKHKREKASDTDTRRGRKESPPAIL